MSQDPSILRIAPTGTPFFTAPDGTVVQTSGGVEVDLTGLAITVAPIRRGDEASIVLSDSTFPTLGPNQLLVTGLVNITPDDIGKLFVVRNASMRFGIQNPTPPPAILFGADNNGLYTIIARGTGYWTETESVIIEPVAPLVRASDVLTATANFADGESVTVGDDVLGPKTYTFQAVLTNVDGNVQIGVDLATSLQNLFDAINLTGTAGTQYATDTTPNTTVFASAVAATTLTVLARLAGFSGNSIGATETAANASWATPTLTGGVGVGIFAPDPINGEIEWAIVDPDDFNEGDPLTELAERAEPLRINSRQGPARFADYDPRQPPLTINRAGDVFSKVQKS